MSTARTEEPRLAGRGPRIGGAAPGLLAAGSIAAVATILGHLLPIVGAPAFAILGGVGVAVFLHPTERIRPGLRFASKYVLQGSIVLLGAELSLHQVVATGASSLPVLAGTLSVALIGAAVLGRAMRIDADLRTLIGVGTGICGASAIAAADTVISASDADVSYAVATIFTFNVIAVLTFPTLGRLMAMTPHGFGLWAGTAVNDLSSVVAASSIFGHGATSYAVVVKLTRTLMIVPICIALGLWRTRARRQTLGAEHPTSHRALRGSVPLFIGWFLVAVIANTAGLIPAAWHSVLSTSAQVMITIALAAIGLSTRIGDIRRTGLKPLALGAALWFLVAVTSLGLQAALGTRV
ncbi:MAG: YeiH family protein [Actinomycetota bacterium]